MTDPVRLADYEFDRGTMEGWYEFHARLPVPKPPYLIVTEDDIKALRSIGGAPPTSQPAMVLGIPIYTQAQIDRGEHMPKPDVKDAEILRAAASILRRGWGDKAKRITPRVVLKVLTDLADQIEDRAKAKA